jgi:large subunit ribosomal protein L24
MLKKYHVKKGDTVVINTGVWKNHEGKITAILRKKDRVVLEISGKEEAGEKGKKLGMRTVKKSQANPKGGLTERALSVHVSNVRLKEAKPEETKTA